MVGFPWGRRAGLPQVVGMPGTHQQPVPSFPRGRAEDLPQVPPSGAPASRVLTSTQVYGTPQGICRMHCQRVSGRQMAKRKFGTRCNGVGADPRDAHFSCEEFLVLSEPPFPPRCEGERTAGVLVRELWRVRAGAGQEARVNTSCCWVLRQQQRLSSARLSRRSRGA